jgi:hypothetical protein
MFDTTQLFGGLNIDGFHEYDEILEFHYIGHLASYNLTFSFWLIFFHGLCTVKFIQNIIVARGQWNLPRPGSPILQQAVQGLPA